MPSDAAHGPYRHPAPHVPAEEQIRRQGIAAIAAADELAYSGTWESDEELDEFLADLYAGGCWSRMGWGASVNSPGGVSAGDLLLNGLPITSRWPSRLPPIGQPTARAAR